MLRCTMCGSALLPNAQFCGVCGNGMNNVSSLDRPTDIASTAHRNVQESDIITAPGQFSPLLRLPTNRQLQISGGMLSASAPPHAPAFQAQPQTEEDERHDVMLPFPTWAGANPGSSTQSVPGMPPANNVPSVGSLPPTLTSHAPTPGFSGGQLPPAASPMQPTPPSTPPSWTQHPPYRTPSGDLHEPHHSHHHPHLHHHQEHHQHHTERPLHHPEQKGRRSLKWLLFAALALLVVFGSVVAFAAFSSHIFVGNTNGPLFAATHPANGRLSSGPGVASSATAHLTSTGYVSGQMTNFRFQQCGRIGGTYSVAFSGTIGGKQYIFSLQIQYYHGPGTYTDNSSMQETFSTYPSTAQSWANGATTNLPASATINGGEISGNMSATLKSSSLSNVQITTNWACASGGSGGGGGGGGGGFGTGGGIVS